MSQPDNCKGCRESAQISEEQISEMLLEIQNSDSFNLVEDSIYMNRLIKCNNCKYLQYGSTCLQCGCIIQIRARLLSGTCPHPQFSKW